jgi:hypothetical protein
MGVCTGAVHLRGLDTAFDGHLVQIVVYLQHGQWSCLALNRMHEYALL